MKDKIVKGIAQNHIVVISGDTGCGKTTQVPQLVLDHHILADRSSQINMIVTQPRRISALGVSERMASERHEAVGETCGYSIRLQSLRGPKTRILLCTTGILLWRLQCDPDLASVTHVFVDEVHKRDLQTDFLLIILQDLLRRWKGVKLVLMSATVNAELFSNFFWGMSHPADSGTGPSRHGTSPRGGTPGHRVQSPPQIRLRPQETAVHPGRDETGLSRPTRPRARVAGRRGRGGDQLSPPGGAAEIHRPHAGGGGRPGLSAGDDGDHQGRGGAEAAGLLSGRERHGHLSPAFQSHHHRADRRVRRSAPGREKNCAGHQYCGDVHHDRRCGICCRYRPCQGKSAGRNQSDADSGGMLGQQGVVQTTKGTGGTCQTRHMLPHVLKPHPRPHPLGLPAPRDAPGGPGRPGPTNSASGPGRAPRLPLQGGRPSLGPGGQKFPEAPGGPGSRLLRLRRGTPAPGRRRGGLRAGPQGGHGTHGAGIPSGLPAGGGPHRQDDDLRSAVLLHRSGAYHRRRHVRAQPLLQSLRQTGTGRRGEAGVHERGERPSHHAEGLRGVEGGSQERRRAELLRFSAGKFSQPDHADADGGPEETILRSVGGHRILA
mmetsp:Transcript_31461/g.72008  ORF Transcript_31461/g.72008 Transcript_31461/m.72008 type:complete len:603 (+) Transcript_31461:784-2592(+)